jgi:membrane protein DedA with SNARE-associated domain
VNDVLGWILDTVRQVDPVLRVLLAGLGIFLETSILIGLVVPGDTIVLVASTAITNWAEWAALFVAVVLGALAGESVGFALGRYFGPRIRVSRLGRRMGETNWVRAKNYVDRRGGIAVFVSRFLPVLHALIPLTVGMSSMRYRKFLAWTAPACVLWAGAYVSVGWLAAGSYRQLSSQLHYAGYLFAAIIAVFLLLALLAKKLIVRSEARHMDAPEADPPNGRDTPNDGDGAREP